MKRKKLHNVECKVVKDQEHKKGLQKELWLKVDLVVLSLCMDT